MFQKKESTTNTPDSEIYNNNYTMGYPAQNYNSYTNYGHQNQQNTPYYQSAPIQPNTPYYQSAPIQPNTPYAYEYPYNYPYYQQATTKSYTQQTEDDMYYGYKLYECYNQLGTNEKAVILKFIQSAFGIRHDNSILRSQIESILFDDGRSIFKLKDYFMYKDEALLFNKLTDTLSLKRNKYIVFPQVALYSFLECTDGAIRNISKKLSLNKELYEKDIKRALKSIYLNLSIDYLICEIKGDGYKPILGIELDGASHNKFDQQYRDKIKNSILPKEFLIRHPQEGEHFTDKDFDEILENIHKNGCPDFSDEKTHTLKERCNEFM